MRRFQSLKWAQSFVVDFFIFTMSPVDLNKDITQLILTFTPNSLRIIQTQSHHSEMTQISFKGEVPLQTIRNIFTKQLSTAHMNCNPVLANWLNFNVERSCACTLMSSWRCTIFFDFVLHVFWKECYLSVKTTLIECYRNLVEDLLDAKLCQERCWVPVPFYGVILNFAWRGVNTPNFSRVKYVLTLFGIKKYITKCN